MDLRKHGYEQATVYVATRLRGDLDGGYCYWESVNCMDNARSMTVGWHKQFKIVHQRGQDTQVQS